MTIMRLQEQLLQNPALTFDGNMFRQQNFAATTFVDAYLTVRHLEGRGYSDDVVRSLPAFKGPASLRQEWAIRRASLAMVRQYLARERSTKTILELGCGNGWFSHQLATTFTADVCAMDINLPELQQGARVFSHQQNLCFLQGDIFTMDFKPTFFDVIILVASIQYFQDVKALLRILCKLLSDNGKIYIADSPLYQADQVAQAKTRSAKHYAQLGVPGMSSFYFHHTFDDLKEFDHTIAYNPLSLKARVLRKIFQATTPVFPLVIVRR